MSHLTCVVVVGMGFGDMTPYRICHGSSSGGGCSRKPTLLCCFLGQHLFSAGGNDILWVRSLGHKATSQRIKTKPIIRLISMVYFFCSYLKFVAGLTDGE